MPREYHSASSIALGRRCQRAWAYRYIDGLIEPEVPWADIEAGRPCTSRERSLSLGKEVHRLFERYWLWLQLNPGSLPAQIVINGLSLLPSREELRRRLWEYDSLADWDPWEAEQAIGSDNPYTAGLARWEGLVWKGSRDLCLLPTIDPLQVDYKTTRDIRRWAKTPEDLRQDLQAALYTADLCERLKRDRIHSRWLYLETANVRRSFAVDFTLTYDEARAIIAEAAVNARELDRIPTSADAPTNPLACFAYGGCQYHESRGGPCTAQATIRTDKERVNMANLNVNAEALARLQSLRPQNAPNPTPQTGPAGQQPATPAPDPTGAVASIDAVFGTAEADGQAAAGAEEKAPEKSKRGKKTPPPAPTAAPLEGVSGQLAAMAQAVAQKEAAVEFARAELFAALAVMQEFLSSVARGA